MATPHHSVLCRALLALALLAMPAAAPVQAETSSWIDRATDVAPATRKDKPLRLEKPAATRPARAAPPTATGGDMPTSKLDGRPAGSDRGNVSSFAKTSPSSGATTPVSGEDAAYLAFDEGKYLTALDLAQKAAKGGDPQAHTLIGRIYQEGLGVKRDAATAAKWYARAAELGDTEGQFAYGILLAEGEGVAKDRVAAGKMFEAAAMKGHALANYNLALLFLRGDGKPENPYRAARHMRYAAEQGVVAAQYDLGTLYATGTGVDPNAFEAAKWIGKAAAAGNPEAELDFGVLLMRGQGVPVDQKRAISMLRAAAEKGVAVAQNRLARCYAYGLGVAADAGEAAKWNLIAKASGLEDPALDKMVAKMARGDRLKAEQAASAWQDRAAFQ